MTNSLPEVQTVPSVASTSVSNRNIVTAARGGGMVFAGKMTGQAVSFIFGLIVARYLGAFNFGLYKLGFTLVDTVATLALLGLNSAVVRYISIARQREDKARLLGTIQIGLIGPGIVSLTLGLILFIFADQIALQVFSEPKLVPVLRLFSINVPLLTLIVMGTFIIQGFKKVEYIYVRSIGGRLVNLLMVSLMLFAGLNVLGVVATQIISSAFALVFLIYFIHKLIPLNQPWNAAKREIGELMRYSLPVYIGGVLNELGGKFESLVLGFFGMTAGLGIFSVAATLAGLSNIFHGSMGTISSPMFAELYDRKDYNQLKRVYHATTKWSFAFSLPFAVILVFFGRDLLGVFGREFKAGTLSLVILVMASLFNAFTGQSGSVINMIGQSKMTAINSAIYLAATLILDFSLIPYWGMEGAALAASLTSILINFLRMVEVYHFIHLWPFDWSILKPVGAAVVATGAGYVISQLLAQTHPIMKVSLGIFGIWVIYALVTFLLKLSPEDRLILSRVGRRLGPKKSQSKSPES